MKKRNFNLFVFIVSSIYEQKKVKIVKYILS